MKKTVFTLVAAILVVAGLLDGASVPARAEGNALSLQKIYAIAKENNGELRALREDRGVGEAVHVRAGLFPNPVLELEGATGAMTGSSGESRVAVGISQEFLTGGKRGKRLAVAETERLRLAARYQDAERQLMVDITTVYYDLLLTEGRRNLAEKSRDLASQLLQITRERFGAGDIAELDLNLAKVEFARSAGRSSEAERELVPLQQRLFALMGVSPADTLQLAALPEVKPFSAQLPELKARALANRPDLQVAVADKKKSEAEVALAEAERIPNVTAGIGVSWERSVTSLGGIEERSADYVLGFKLSVPIPLLDRNQAGIAEGAARKNSAEARLQSMRQNIEREVESAFGRLANAEKTLQIYVREIIPQLTENLQLIQESYRLGEVGIMAVIEEQKKFVDVNEGHLSAVHDRNRALAQLEIVVGSALNYLDGGAQ